MPLPTRAGLDAVPAYRQGRVEAALSASSSDSDLSVRKAATA